ncbi:hypothetical protein L6452_38077 [Arctium lappa]|uniref:Uncharacterized protein n=1 Tax=Arctium lappa TaxID=4217 RepID=A0ACB8Y4Q6_ARCLA|nr:hypothetical protein L6452_38077 [Arctium lappa]
MKDRHTGQPRGFGLITYADPSVVDMVIEDTHVFNGKEVETREQSQEDLLIQMILKHRRFLLEVFQPHLRKVAEHLIIRDHGTDRSCGFGFVIFGSVEVVDELLSNGNVIDMDGTQMMPYLLRRAKENKGLSSLNLDRQLMISSEYLGLDAMLAFC